MLEERGGQVGEDRLLVRGRPAEAGALLGLGHDFLLVTDRELLQLLGLGVVLVAVGFAEPGVGVAPGTGRGVVAGNAAGVEGRGAVLQRQAERMQLDLDLIDGLLTEVADVEQVGFRACHQLTDGVNTSRLRQL